MKIKVVPFLICVGIALLSGYGFYAANSHEWQRWMMFVVASVSFFGILAGGFGINFQDGRNAVSIVTLSVVCVIINLIINLIATLATFHAAPYIISSGILLLLFIGISYAIAKA